MNTDLNYKEINRKSWNNKVDTHMSSEFYDIKGFLSGKSSLNPIELGLLGNFKGKSILHLQCHFGKDSISLSREGAQTTGVDLSDKAIRKAKELAKKCKVDTTFICSDIFDLPHHLDREFDIVFASYGTIGWLPDLKRWAEIIARYMKPEGRFVFAEFHPVLWMFDDDFDAIKFGYFNTGAIEENIDGTYADTTAAINQDYIMWNHSLEDIISSLLNQKLRLDLFEEYNYSPYDCFQGTVEIEPGKFQIKKMGDKLPMVFALQVSK